MNLNATVQASAGSGKTYLLINRLVRLLLLGAEPATIIAITFTRKAATEMQKRLLQKVHELSCATPEKLAELLAELQLSPRTKALEEKARHLYEELLYTSNPVKATTFHAFCQDILRRFPLEADVPPGFELLEQTRSLQHQAVEALMVEVVHDRNSELHHAINWLLDHLGMHTTGLILATFIQQRSEWWAFTQNQTEPLQYAIEHLKSQLQIKDESASPLERFFSDKNIETDSGTFIQLLELHPTKTNLAHARTLATALNLQENLEEKFKTIWQVFFTSANEPRARKSTATQQKKMGVSGEETFLDLHSRFCEQLQQVQQQLNTLFTYTMNKAWYTAGYRALCLYQQFKLEQRLLDFADLEWKTYKLLNHGENAQWIQYKLDARIDHLLIDEFQDTNPTQWHLISPLLEEIASQQQNLSSVFLVGDAKQSIYRFRRAEPRLFDFASDWMDSALQAETIPLNRSWRSAPAIISFINTTFGSGELHDQLSHFIPHEVQYTKRWGKVSLLPLVKEPEHQADAVQWRNPLQQPRAEKISRRYTLEAEQIARIIQELVSNHTVVEDGDHPRSIRYADVIILLRNRVHIEEYERALRHAGIPYSGDARGTLLKSLEIADLVNLLQWLNMPQDDLALAGILRSPLFSITDDDLVLLANSSGRFWYERLAGLAQGLETSHPLAAANHLLENWRRLAGQVPVHDLLDHIYSSGNVLERFAASYPQHQRDRVTSNLNGFIELALNMDSGRYPSLMRFIQWLKELYQLESDAPDEPVSGQAADRVRLLTIHAAKGLEAPVVFLADAANKPKGGHAYSVLLHWPLGSSGPVTFMLAPASERQDPFSKKLIEQKQKDDSREEANLLYVALSRSGQLLYISGSISGRSNYTGWYGQIARQYQLDPLEITETQILEASGSMPSATQQTDKSGTTPPTPNPLLSRPLELSKTFHEIAPSKMADADIQTGTKQAETARLRGIVIHEMLDKLSVNHELELPVFLQTPAIASLTTSLGKETLSAYWKEAQNIVNYREFAGYFAPQYYDKALNEVPLIYKQDALTVHGIIDRLIVRQQSILFIDYKSHTHVTHDNADEMARTYTTQMQYYRNGLAKIWPDKDIHGIIIFTHCALAIELEL